MRTTEKFVKLTLREDKDLIRALVEAMISVRLPGQIKTLADVKYWIVDQGQDLSHDRYRVFREVLFKLGVEPNKTAGGGERDSCYAIPKDPKAKAKALNVRLGKRQRHFERLIAEAGMADQDVADLFGKNDPRHADEDHEVLATVLSKALSDIDLLKAEVDRLNGMIEPEPEPVYRDNVVAFRR